EDVPPGRISTPPKRSALISPTPYARSVQQMRTRTGSQTKFLLEESQLPRHWYNVRSDMPTALQPVLHPGTGQPVGPDDLAPLFPMEVPRRIHHPALRHHLDPRGRDPQQHRRWRHDRVRGTEVCPEGSGGRYEATEAG